MVRKMTNAPLRRWGKLHLLTLLTVLSGFWGACLNSPTSPEQTSPRILFKLSNLSSGPTEGWLPNILNRTPPGLALQADIDEVRIAVLNLRQSDDGGEFVDAWFASNQTVLIDTTKWDDNLDFFDNAASLLQSYPGDHYRFAGDFTLSVEGDTARGSINARPGLNYFLIALRQEGSTRDWGEMFFPVDEERENVICFGCGGPSIEITSPADGSVSTSNVITITGTVSDTSITEIALILGDISQSISVTNGTFSSQVVLAVGLNRIVLQAVNDTGTGIAVITVEFQGQPAPLRATLVWDSNNTDMDLQMENPNRIVCSFLNREVGGMRLDVDNAAGFGPENISVNQQIVGEYITRVVNFSASAGFGTTATVYIYRNETLIKIRSHTFSGTDEGNRWEASRDTLP